MDHPFQSGFHHSSKHRPLQSAMSRKEDDLASKSRRQLQSMGSHGDPMEKLRLCCLCRGARGILNLGRMFRRLDDEGNKNLNIEEFTKGLRDSGIEVNDADAREVFQLFDPNYEGTINIYEFLVSIRPPMPDSRQKVIEECFKKLDKNGDGQLTIDHLRDVYNVKDSSRYISGEEDEETMMNTFLANFEDEITTDGIVTKEDFLNYYAAISASVDNDGYFDLMLRQFYKL